MRLPRARSASLPPATRPRVTYPASCWNAWTAAAGVTAGRSSAACADPGRCRDASLELALAAQVRFELGEHADHVKEALAGGRAGVDRLLGRLEQPSRAHLKARAKAAGLDPKVFAGHSLRSGFVTSAADAGASLQSIADHALHTRLDTTRGYVQIADAFRHHSGKRFLCLGS
jgi:hypothetical protein